MHLHSQHPRVFHNTEDTNTMGKGKGSANDSKTMTS